MNQVKTLPLELGCVLEALTATMSDEEEEPRRVYPSETAALTAGKALQKAGELDDAADAFGQALELAIGAHGEESSATADYYMAYGDVLLEIVDKSGDVFGTGAAPNEDPRANQENTGASPPQSRLFPATVALRSFSVPASKIPTA